MIARIWRGATQEPRADDYLAYLMDTGVESYRATEGNRGVRVLRRVEGGRAEFLIFTLWESYDAIKRFAGDNVEVPVYYPKDGEYLLECEPRVFHYEVLLDLPDPTAVGEGGPGTADRID